MPSARDITAMAVTNGVLKSVRKASFRLVMEFPRGCRRIGSCTRERDPASLRLTGLGTYDLRHRFVPRGLVELHMASLRGPRQARPPMPEGRGPSGGSAGGYCAAAADGGASGQLRRTTVFAERQSPQSW